MPESLEPNFVNGNRRRLEILLLSPPLTEPAIPNLAIELLAANARHHGHHADTLHCALMQPSTFSDGLVHGLAAPTAFVPSYFGIPESVVAEQAARATIDDFGAREHLPPEHEALTDELLFFAACEATLLVDEIAEHISRRPYDLIGF